MNNLKNLFFILMLIPLPILANIRPMIAGSFGSDQTSIYRNTTISILLPFENTYTGLHSHNKQFVSGLFLGGETDFFQQLRWEYGIRYFQTQPFHVSGIIYQLADPLQGNLTYHYRIQNRRLLLETKLLTAFKKRYHPYLLGDLGESFNKTYGYHEVSKTSADLALTPPFVSAKFSSFSYSVGLGLDFDCTNHLRLGLNYRWSQLGYAALGRNSIQESATVINHPSLSTNEVLLELSYVV